MNKYGSDKGGLDNLHNYTDLYSNLFLSQKVLYQKFV